MVSAGVSIFFDFTNNYKLEIWAVILSIIAFTLVVSTIEQKPVNVTVTVPENAIKISINMSDLKTASIEKSPADLAYVDVDTSNIKKWKDVKVGEISLKGEEV
jgi:hypothetical protein